MSFTQVQPPPGVDVVAGVRAGTVFPRAVAAAVDGVVRGSELVQRRLRGFSLEGQVLSCRNNACLSGLLLLRELLCYFGVTLGVVTCWGGVAVDLHLTEGEDARLPWQGQSDVASLHAFDEGVCVR